MIVGESEIHHWTNDNLSIDCNGTIFNRVHPKNRCLRRIKNRRGQQRAKDTTIRYGERATRHFIDRELLIARLQAQISNRGFDIGNAHKVSIAQDGHYKTVLC